MAISIQKENVHGSHNANDNIIRAKNDIERNFMHEDAANDSMSDDSLTEDSMSDVRKDRKRLALGIAHKETQLVNRSKIVVLTVIFVLSIVMAVSTALFVRRDELNDFKSRFKSLANDIEKVSNIRTRALFDSLASVSAQVTAYARASGSQWPLVRVPDYQIFAMMSNEITGAATLDFIPFVQNASRLEWETFSAQEVDWVDEGHYYDDNVHPSIYEYKNNVDQNKNFTFLPYIYYDTPNWELIRESYDKEFYAPLWQRAPSPDKADVNLNLRWYQDFDRYLVGMIENEQPVLTAVSDASYLAYSYNGRFTQDELKKPHSYLFQPVYDNFLKDRNIVGMLAAFLRWDNFLINLLPDSESGIVMVLEGTCNDIFTYVLEGQETRFIGIGDWHDPDFNDIKQSFDFAPFATLKASDDSRFCQYKANLYPSKEWQEQFNKANNEYLYGFGVFACFLVTSLVFVAYDILVQRRQEKVMDTATKTNAIVSSLFPENVRDRLIQELKPNKYQHQDERSVGSSQKQSTTKLHGGGGGGGGARFTIPLPLSRSLGWQGSHNQRQDEEAGETHDLSSSITTSESIFGSKPIADLFPNTTIMFADMTGFTAWSSVRDPTQVFSLLETIYHSFDVIAIKLGIFKVETIGDCYVAATGLPEPRTDHAVAMAKFASECIQRMSQVVNLLEQSLGAGTAELQLRIGLHSGQVTAGVLRGEKGRFQLFGDAMNTASRMESTGIPGKIQVSAETADKLIQANKSKWITPREDRIVAKGKGEMQTYWVIINNSQGGSDSSSSKELVKATVETASEDDDQAAAAAVADWTINKGSLRASGKVERLVKWHTETLLVMLKKILARRGESSVDHSSHNMKSLTFERQSSSMTVLDEFQDVIKLPKFDKAAIRRQLDPSTIKLPNMVTQQVEHFVAAVAALYNKENPFHNFEHASHVTMSVSKLLNRIVNPNEISDRHSSPYTKIASDLHDHTFGITSDPLTQFACIFSALIHDLDHPGVPNSTLVSENHEMAIQYKAKSVAEQNSVDKAWTLLMQPRYEAFRYCIFGTDKEELQRFRQIVVNVVMATDIMDKDLGALRKARWQKAFDKQEISPPTAAAAALTTTASTSDTDYKATIVIEHLIQASDIAHTMQHWHVYRKWNERLFQEMYQAYKSGRSNTDPSIDWYKGEIGFFDHYIIPLAKKLDTCGVFGVSSDEYLNYAEQNRREWEEKGEDIVKSYLESCQQQ